MIIDEKFKKELLELENSIYSISQKNSITDLQLEKFLRTFEKTRYEMLNQIKLYNANTDFEYEKISTIDDDYKAEIQNNVLQLYVPETLPSFKNIKTHTHKRIMLNIIEVAKQYEGVFENGVFIYIKIFDKILGWDVDNRYIKPVADALIHSKVIKDDNFKQMSYCVKGEYSENPHTEIYIFDSQKINDFLSIYSI